MAAASTLSAKPFDPLKIQMHMIKLSLGYQTTWVVNIIYSPFTSITKINICTIYYVEVISTNFCIIQHTAMGRILTDLICALIAVKTDYYYGFNLNYITLMGNICNSTQGNNWTGRKAITVF